MKSLELRWDNKEDDLASYNLIFDSALELSRSQDDIQKAAAKLLFQILNRWEEDHRSIPIQVVSAAYDLALASAVEALIS